MKIALKILTKLFWVTLFVAGFVILFSMHVLNEEDDKLERWLHRW